MSPSPFALARSWLSAPQPSLLVSPPCSATAPLRPHQPYPSQQDDARSPFLSALAGVVSRSLARTVPSSKSTQTRQCDSHPPAGSARALRWPDGPAAAAPPRDSTARSPPAHPSSPPTETAA